MYTICTCLYVFTLLASVCGVDFQNINGEKCRSYYTVGYKYNDWYAVVDTAGTNSRSNDSVLLRFYVQGASNAHIMLTSGPSSFGYEIVLGGGFNSFCDIRKQTRMKSVAFSPTKNIIDSQNPVGFWIRTSYSSGTIEVGLDKEDLPFMFWTDPEPISVSFFSFSSWDAVVCKWLFNCQPDAAAKTDYANKFLTYMERLRRDVLKKRGTFGADYRTMNETQLLNVMITSNFNFIHLDVLTSVLTLRGIATFEWTDKGVRWNPKNYGNISKVHLSNYELWRPELVLHNALEPAVSMFTESKISVDHEGRVIWRPKFTMKSTCDVDLKSWPRDQHNCTVLLSSWSHKISNIFYQLEDNTSECFNTIHSDWKLDRMTTSYVEESTPWDDVEFSVHDDETSDGLKQVSLQLVVEISRNTKILEKLFYAPFILISCIWLSSFCITTNFTSKITTISVSVIISSLSVVHMTTYVPVFTKLPPKLMLGYLELMLLMSTDAFVSSFILTMHCHKTTSGHPPFALTRFLTTPVVTKCLVLPKLETTVDYDLLNNGSGGERETITTLWDIVIVAFQRIVFTTYYCLLLKTPSY